MDQSTNFEGTGAVGGDRETLRREARGLVSEAGRAGRDLLAATAEHQKAKARGGLGSLARAVHSAAESLDHEAQQPLGRLGHRAAAQIERFEGYLSGSDFETLLRDGRDAARRNPTLFLSGLFVGGVVLGRLLRSAPPAAEGVFAAPVPTGDELATAAERREEEGFGGPVGGWS